MLLLPLCVQILYAAILLFIDLLGMSSAVILFKTKHLEINPEACERLNDPAEIRMTAQEEMTWR